MSDKRAHNPEALLDPKKALESASNLPVITVPMREVREYIERGEEIPSIPADQFKLRGWE